MVPCSWFALVKILIRHLSKIYDNDNEQVRESSLEQGLLDTVVVITDDPQLAEVVLFRVIIITSFTSLTNRTLRLQTHLQNHNIPLGTS